MARWLHALREATAEPAGLPSVSCVSDRPRDAAEPGHPSVSCVSAQPQGASVSGVLPGLLARVARAASWGDLHAIVDDADRAFAAGDLSAAEAETVAERCIARSREVPAC